jgi:hypothetical protein
MRTNASSRLPPQKSGEGWYELQTAGRVGFPNSLQRLSIPRWGQRTPAGFPNPSPGIGLEIEIATQQAPQARHFMA